MAVTILAVDQITKIAVAATLARGESSRVLGEFLRITHVRNPGAAFGMLRGFGGLLALIATIGIVVFVVLIMQRPPTIVAVGAALVAGGASGNLTDRVFRGPFGRGEVVDFVDFMYWPAFNVADSAITIGAILLIWSGFRPEKDEPDRAGS